MHPWQRWCCCKWAHSPELIITDALQRKLYESSYPNEKRYMFGSCTLHLAKNKSHFHRRLSTNEGNKMVVSFNSVPFHSDFFTFYLANQRNVGYDKKNCARHIHTHLKYKFLHQHSHVIIFYVIQQSEPIKSRKNAAGVSMSIYKHGFRFIHSFHA